MSLALRPLETEGRHVRWAEPRTADSTRERHLAERVEHAVEEISEESGAEAPTRRWEVLLGILTYCYALGIYGSDEIETAIGTDPNADSLYALAFRDTTPAATLRAFRRANRHAILQSLSRVLDDPDSPGEAMERVRLAIEADSRALDF